MTERDPRNPFDLAPGEPLFPPVARHRTPEPGCDRCGKPSGGMCMSKATDAGWWFTPPTDEPDGPDAYCPECAAFLKTAVRREWDEPTPMTIEEACAVLLGREHNGCVGLDDGPLGTTLLNEYGGVIIQLSDWEAVAIAERYLREESKTP